MKRKTIEKVKDILAIPLAVIMLGGIALIPHIWLWSQDAGTSIRVITAIFHGVALLAACIFIVCGYHGLFAEEEGDR